MTEKDDKAEHPDTQANVVNRAQHFESLAAVEELIDYQFFNRQLLARALTHSSAKNQDHPSYERLEFLGDSILGLTMTDYLFKNYPQFSEGALSRLRSVLVSSKTLAKVVRSLGLDQYLLVSRGLQKSKTPNGLCADIFEAVTAAIYLDSNYDKARTWVFNHLKGEVANLSKNLEDHNWKSRLQQYTQKHMKAIPKYQLTSTTGPNHCPVFHVQVTVAKTILGVGEGHNKKTAEQAAAKAACEELIGREGGLTKVRS